MKNSVVVFQNEVHFMAQTTVTRSWAPVGSAPKIKSLPGRDKISFSGFVVPKTAQLFMDKPDRFNYETVIASIRSFLSAYEPGEGTRIFLIMDNAGWHKKAKRLIKENVDGKYDDINRFVTFVYMPPYSPDLNPIEQVWRKTRREATHNRYFKNKAELESKLDTYYGKFRAPNQELSSLCSFNYESQKAA